MYLLSIIKTFEITQHNFIFDITNTLNNLFIFSAFRPIGEPSTACITRYPGNKRRFTGSDRSIDWCQQRHLGGVSSTITISFSHQSVSSQYG